MAYTHTYELEIGDNTFEGEMELSNAGLVAFSDDTNPMMPKKTRDTIDHILEQLSVIYSDYNDFKKLKIKVK